MVQFQGVTPVGLNDIFGIKPTSQTIIKNKTINLNGQKISTKKFWKIETMDADILGESNLSDYPGITINKVGKGKAIYIAGDIFKEYYSRSGYSYRPTGNNKLIRNFIKTLVQKSGLQTNCKINASPWFEFVLREKENNTYLHVINRSINWKQNEIQSEKDINIEINRPKEPLKVLLQPGNEAIEHTWKKGKLEFTLKPDNIEFHRIVEIR